MDGSEHCCVRFPHHAELAVPETESTGHAFRMAFSDNARDLRLCATKPSLRTSENVRSAPFLARTAVGLIVDFHQPSLIQPNPVFNQGWTPKKSIQRSPISMRLKRLSNRTVFGLLRALGMSVGMATQHLLTAPSVP
jgi:hypothetical protein